MARGLFVESFYGGSHRAFADGLVAHGGHALELLTLPGRAWRRRMRLGAQVLAERAKLLPEAFDFLLVTDMLDLPTFLALTRPRFAETPVLLFMHENQLTYPRLRGTRLNSWFGQINYLSALSADRVAFNSDYHRNDFVTALKRLSQQRNNWLEPAAIEAIRTKSTVLPVGFFPIVKKPTRPTCPTGHTHPTRRQRRPRRAPHPLEPPLGIRQGARAVRTHDEATGRGRPRLPARGRGQPGGQSERGDAGAS